LEGIQRVRLSLQPATLAVRTHHFDNAKPFQAENAAEFCTIRSGSLHPDRCDRTIVMKKVDDPPIAHPRRGELFIPQCPPDLVDEGNMVGISVRIDSSINF